LCNSISLSQLKLISFWRETSLAPETCPERSDGSCEFMRLNLRSFRANALQDTSLAFPQPATNL
ncbi:MAG: hypothetical protein NT027_12830, partial [Proteobacteria bacterium]|nr:hypothetical protein [Pseudomonadota bacterium]